MINFALHETLTAMLAKNRRVCSACISLTLLTHRFHLPIFYAIVSSSELLQFNNALSCNFQKKTLRVDNFVGLKVCWLTRRTYHQTERLAGHKVKIELF